VIPAIKSILASAGAAFFLITGAAACGERPQRVMQEDDRASSSETWEGQMRDRTLKQGESERMAY